MSFNDVIKSLTVQAVEFLNSSPKERKEKKEKMKASMKKPTQSTYSNKWFGVLPFVVKSSFKQKEK